MDRQGLSFILDCTAVLLNAQSVDHKEVGNFEGFTRFHIE
jgi:hypothetical protein